MWVGYFSTYLPTAGCFPSATSQMWNIPSGSFPNNNVSTLTWQLFHEGKAEVLNEQFLTFLRKYATFFFQNSH